MNFVLYLMRIGICCTRSGEYDAISIVDDAFAVKNNSSGLHIISDSSLNRCFIGLCG